MKHTPELNRFLNYIEREQNKIRTEYKNELLLANYRTEVAKSETSHIKQQLATVSVKLNTIEPELETVRLRNTEMMCALRLLLPKIRVNVNGKKCTPRWFKSGKWWSRETGGLEESFINEMTEDEITEAAYFYGKTELSLMLPSSNRDKKLNEMKGDIE